MDRNSEETIAYGKILLYVTVAIKSCNQAGREVVRVLRRNGGTGCRSGGGEGICGVEVGKEECRGRSSVVKGTMGRGIGSGE